MNIRYIISFLLFQQINGINLGYYVQKLFNLSVKHYHPKINEVPNNKIINYTISDDEMMDNIKLIENNILNIKNNHEIMCHIAFLLFI
jgi:hypothetical protein